jgi:hypothetical protein
MRRTLYLAFAALVSLAVAIAAGPARDAPRAATPTWLLEEEAYALVRFDATSPDTESLARAVANILPIVTREYAGGVAQLKAFVAAFKAAGGTEAILAFATPELPQASALFVPLKTPGEDEALTKLLKNVVPNGWQIEQRKDGLVAGTAKTLDRLRQSKGANRPDLEAALAAADSAPLQAWLFLGDDHRRVIREVAAAAPGLGLLPLPALASQWRGAAVSLGADPKAALKLRIQAVDAAAATQLAAGIRSGLDSLGRLVLFGETRPLAEVLPDEFKTAHNALTPAVAGDQITLTISDPATLKVIARVASAVEEQFGPLSQSVSGANMKRILVAMHRYAVSHDNRFPATAIRAKDGTPLLSWRVAILPFLGEDELYREFRLNEPWDSDHNKKLIGKMPALYRSPMIEGQKPGLTTYLVPVGQEAAFTGGPQGRLQSNEFSDGLSNTILLLDVADDRAVPWTKPEDLTVDPNDPMKGLLGHYLGYCLVGMADGTVHRVAKSISKATLRSAFTPSGAETLGPDW